MLYGVQHRQSFPCLLLLPHLSFFLPLPLSLHPHSPLPLPLQQSLHPLTPSLPPSVSSSPPSLSKFGPGRQVGSATGVLLSLWQPPPTPSLSHQLLSVKHMHVSKHTQTWLLKPWRTHTSLMHPVSPQLVCSTHPCEWYLASPCLAPISVPTSGGVDVSQLGVVAVAWACYWPELMASLPV